MGFWSTLLNIVIFIIALGTLIVIHEAGHLTTAKIFKVYCYEFSVGMGPALFKHKRKGGETTFSIRAIPLGGYVSMAGEDMDESEKDSPIDVVVPRERTIEGIARWKRIIIMGAGVFLNFILGYVVYFINYAAVPQNIAEYTSTKVNVASDGILSKAGFITSDDPIKEISQIFYYFDGGTKELLNAQVSRYAFQNSNEITYLNYNSAISNVLSCRYVDVEKSTSENVVYIDYRPKAEADYRLVYITYEKDGKTYTNGIEGSFDKAKISQYKEVKTSSIFVKSAGTEILSFNYLGVSISTHQVTYGFVKAFGMAWNQWVYSCSAIFVGIGMLFTPEGWAGAGGIISIFKVSSMAVENGLSSVLSIWGFISVNLGIMNLLPFPGLDGWQILVTSVEGVTRKEIPSKAKNIVSMIGLFLLIGLSIVLLIKDIIAPAI